MQQKEKNQKVKKAIGILLLIAIAYFLLTNFDLADWPKFGVKIEGPTKTCTEIRAPKTMTDTEISQLKVNDLGFKVVDAENRAELTVQNVDNITGEVRVLLYCRNGAQQGDDRKSIGAGETAVFTFFDTEDCDLDYIIEPEMMKKRVTKTVYVNDSVCE
jgi:hypothetical protein